MGFGYYVHPKMNVILGLGFECNSRVRLSQASLNPHISYI